MEVVVRVVVALEAAVGQMVAWVQVVTAAVWAVRGAAASKETRPPQRASCDPRAP